MAYPGMKERLTRELVELSPLYHEGISVTAPGGMILTLRMSFDL
jgi:hypothetical protein